jgi:glyoxylase-like metal-dependent hydrolase (beta-lactamase superfamily II)
MRIIYFTYRLYLFVFYLLICIALGLPSTVSGQVTAPAELIEVAPDLYFNYDYGGSNSAVLVTEAGILVVDTRMHPDDAERLLDEIRRISDAPIRWVINSQFHGDHYMGNAVFAREGATIIAHRDTQEVILERFEYEVETRPFEQRGQNRDDVVLVLPDILFDRQLTLDVGGVAVELIYLGAGQNEGDTLVHFPHARALHTGGVFHNRSWANTSYTPSVDGWLSVLRAMRRLDVDVYLPPHGPLASLEDLDDFIEFIDRIHSGVKAAVDRGATLEETLAENLFTEYSDWRGYERRERNLTALFELLTVGEAQYFVPSSRAAPSSQ